jgi:FkbM family methyltransferase
MLGRLYGLARYNRDWPMYLWHRYSTPGSGLATYRLRNGQTITLKPDVRFTLNEIYLDRAYDVPGVDFATCGSVLDLGANVGIFALYVASRSKAVVHCFEPESSNFALLEQNLRANHSTARAYRLALSTRCGSAPLYFGPTAAEHGLGVREGPSEVVECVDLDLLFARTGVERFDFVKMDIEGAEREVLLACTDEQLRRMGALSLEWHHSAPELEELARRLRSLRFEVSAQPTGGRGRLLKARLR